MWVVLKKGLCALNRAHALACHSRTTGQKVWEVFQDSGLFLGAPYSKNTEKGYMKGSLFSKAPICAQHPMHHHCVVNGCGRQSKSSVLPPLARNEETDPYSSPRITNYSG